MPTADDLRVRLVDGSEVARTKNEAVVLTPYLAVLATPTDRLFFQAWGQVGFSANGNSVLANSGTGLTRVGVLTDQVLLQLDGQVGYWVVRTNDCSRWVGQEKRSIARGAGSLKQPVWSSRLPSFEIARRRP